MKHTVIWMAVYYGLGIFISFALPQSPITFIAATLLVAVTLKLVISRGRLWLHPILLLCCIALGMISIHFANDVTFKGPANYLGRYVTVQGRICVEPNQSKSADYYTLQLEQLTFNGNTVPLADKISVAVFKEDEGKQSYAYGDIITAQGFIQLLPEALNSKGYDAALIYKTKGIFFQLKCSTSKTQQIGHDRAWWRFADAGFAMRKYSIGVINRYLTGLGAVVTKAILLGDKSGLDEAVILGLQVSGLSHITSVSGLHISSMLSVLGWLLLAFGLRKRWISIIFFAFLGFIVIYEGATVTIVRAAIMSGVYIAGDFLRRDTHMPTTLAFAALCMLLYNPFALLDVSFQLSVGSIAGILLFAEPFTQWIRRCIKIKWIAASFGTTAAVLLFISPVIAYYFNTFSLVTLFANLLVVPLLPCILFSTMFIILFSWLYPVAILLAGFLQVVSGAIGAFLAFVGKLPFAAVDVASPAPIFLLIYGLVLYILFALIHQRKSFQTYMAASAAAGLIVVCIVSAFLHSSQMTVTFINVGQGDAALIHLPDNKKMIIDGGGSPVFSKANIGESVFVPYLKKQGAFTIDVAVASHYDQDHSQGIIAALQQLRVKNLIIPYRSQEYEQEAKKKLEELAAMQGTRVFYFLDSDSIDFGQNTILKALSPTLEDTGDLRYNENELSLVLKLSFGQMDFLFTGDIEQPIEKKLLAKGQELDCEVLKVAHHGSKTSSHKRFIELVSPDYAVIGVGENNMYRHPSDQVLSVLEEANVQVFRTDQNGDITFEVTKTDIKKATTFK